MESSDERAFLKAIQEQPGDETARLVYADWLDENGKPRHAIYLRAVAEIRKQTQEIDKIRHGIDGDWLESISLAGNDEYEAYLEKKALKFLHWLGISVHVPPAVCSQAKPKKQSIVQAG